MTDKKDLGIGQPVDPKWLELQQQIRNDVEWAMEAGQGQFLIACFAVYPAGKINPADLPAEIKLPRDKDKPIVVFRNHCYFPYADFPLVVREFTSTLSKIQRQKDALLRLVSAENLGENDGDQGEKEGTSKRPEAGKSESPKHA